MLATMIKNNRGVSIVLVALSIIVLLGFGALAVDIGHLYNVKNQLQVAADAAALAACANLNSDKTDMAQYTCRNEARKIAARNFAAVATSTVPGATDTDVAGNVFNYQGASDGEPIPVYLSMNDSNLESGDIVVGNFDFKAGSFHPGTTPVNAVLVRARRGNQLPQQPPVDNWFAKVFKLLGADFDLSNISAVAIAAKNNPDDLGPLVPIAVNEYWTVGTPTPIYASTGQGYPNSFTRYRNIDTAGTLSTMALNTFAILGALANDNIQPSESAANMNGFLNLDYRSNNHYGLTPTDASGLTNPDLIDIATNGEWHKVPVDAVDCDDCTLFGSPIPPPSEGDISNEEGAHVEYLHMGYPRTPPIPVEELYRPSLSLTYPASQSGGNQVYGGTHDCPYGTVAFFSGSGNEPVEQWPQGSGPHWYERYTKGDRIVSLVYDGTFNTSFAPSNANLVTIVGAVIIEIDGYHSGNPTPAKLVPVTAAERAQAAIDPDFEPDYSENKSKLQDTNKNTAYGHVVPHGLGTTDPFMLTFEEAKDPATGNLDACRFYNYLQQMRQKAGKAGRPRLVYDNEHPQYNRYGIAN